MTLMTHEDARTHARTPVDDSAKDGVVVDRAAVPATMSELPLTLGDGGPSAAADTGHVVGVELTELGLTRRQAGHA